MGRKKQNKKAEIKARRKTRKANEKIEQLKLRERMIKTLLSQIMEERKGVFEKLAQIEASELVEGVQSESESESESESAVELSDEPSSSQDQ